MRRLVHSCAIAVVLASSAPAAHADVQRPAPVGTKDIIGILAFEVTGASNGVARAFERGIEDELKNNGFRVSPRKRLQQLLGPSSYTAGCTFGPCLSEVRRNTEVRLVLVVRISVYGPTYKYVMTLLETESGRPTSQMVDACDVCTLDNAIATLRLAVIALVGGADSAVVDPELGPTGDSEATPMDLQLAAREDEISSRRRRLRQSALFFAGAAALAGGAGAYFWFRDQRDVALPSLGASGALAVASATFLMLSRRF